MLRRYSLIAVAACLTLTSTAANARCSGFDKQVAMVKTLAEAACDVPGVGEYCDIGKQAAQQANLKQNAKLALKEWNALAKNGPSSIGPRRLKVGGNPERGKAFTSRLWVTDAVVNDTVKVTIKHTAKDKSRAVIHLCIVDRKGGKPRWFKTLEFGKNSPQGAKRSAKVPLKNEILLVDINAPTAMRTFTYSISVK